jgi:hypothetical protein
MTAMAKAKERSATLSIHDVAVLFAGTRQVDAMAFHHGLFDTDDPKLLHCPW